MSLDMKKYMEAFIEEAKEHIDMITQSLLVLEKEPGNNEALNNIFRAAHTLKGSSAMMGYVDISNLTHAMEDIFDNLRKGGQVSSDLIDVLLRCIDTLTVRLDKLQEGKDEKIEVDSLIGKLHEKAKTTATPKSNFSNQTINERTKIGEFELRLSEDELKEIKEAAYMGERCFTVKVKFSSDCVFKAIRANMVLDNLAEKGRIIKTIPSRQEIADDKIDLDLQVLLVSKFDEKEIEKLVSSICEIENVQVVMVDVNSLKEEASQAIPKREDANVVVDARSNQTVRVHFDKLDKLMNLVGELVVNKIALIQIAEEIKEEKLRWVVGNIDRLASDMHELVMQIRMVPISQIFDRFPRLVRDLSMKKGKKVELVMEGREIEVDRTVLDEIGQPLIHLIRNCIDHGIEPPEEREKHGKNPTGTIKLTAQRRGDNIIIEVSDDGAGINPKKVKEAAIRKGFISAEDAEKMNNEQLIDLIFLPGLSTSTEITDTSGRGVGMDVVKTKITALGGSVHIDTQQGKGTKVTIKLPLTLAIIKALLVKDSGQIFAIPADQVLEVIQAKHEEIKSIGDFEAMVVRDHVIPLVHLHKLIYYPENEESECVKVLIIHGYNERERIGLVVDSVLRQQEILIKTLDENISKNTSISGATILGDGQVVLVLDIAQLLNKQFKAKHEEEMEYSNLYAVVTR
ncbi:MAG: chemotaxis protein CheA [Candidatus Jordarchaeaceae archaeon]